MFRTIGAFLATVLLAIFPSPLRADDQNPKISQNPAGYSLDWSGDPGRNYFVQMATNLQQWHYFPEIYSGDGSLLSHGFNSNAPRLFTRLIWTDLPDGGDPSAADFDNDGLATQEELTSAERTDPLNPDTDGDGLRDGWERTHGFNPVSTDSDGNGTPDGAEDPDGDGANNETEQNNDSDPNNAERPRPSGGVFAQPILFVEIRDVNGAGDADDVTVTPWDRSQDIANNNIAWIDAHQSAQNATPRMPQLEIRVPGLADELTIEAKLEVKYERGNGARYPSRTDEDGNKDTVKIPADGNFVQVNGDTWEIYSEADWQTELTNQGFFGGDATVTYRIKNGADVVVGPVEIEFRIGGENPDDGRCEAFIQGKPNAGNNGSMSFMYAVAKHESKAKNTNNLYYNQFYELPLHRRDVGRPVWNNDGGTSPGGYGVFQVTGNSTNNLANIPRKELWNWQDNVEAAFSIMNHNIKSGLAGRFYTDIKNDSAAHLQAFNSCLPPNIVADGKIFTSDTAIWITAYNGWGGPIRDRYVFSREKSCGLGATKRWHWNPPLKPSGKTYLTLVAEEI